MSIPTKETIGQKEGLESVGIPAAHPLQRNLPRESRLVSFGDRITYTYAWGKEVGSIHYDRGRQEIFCKGHNIRNIEMEESLLQMLEKFRQVLESESSGRSFAESYGRTLDKILVERAKRTG